MFTIFLNYESTHKKRKLYKVHHKAKIECNAKDTGFNSYKQERFFLRFKLKNS